VTTTDASRHVSSASDVARHFGPLAVTGTDPNRLAWARPRGNTLAHVEWSTTERLVRITAPLDLDLTRIDRHVLALAISEVNLGLEILGLELDTELAFVSHLFFEDGDRVSLRAFDAVVIAIEIAASRLAVVLERMAGERPVVSS
jgi:hypothetical protein